MSFCISHIFPHLTFCRGDVYSLTYRYRQSAASTFTLCSQFSLNILLTSPCPRMKIDLIYNDVIYWNGKRINSGSNIYTTIWDLMYVSTDPSTLCICVYGCWMECLIIRPGTNWGGDLFMFRIGLVLLKLVQKDTELSPASNITCVYISVYQSPVVYIPFNWLGEMLTIHFQHISEHLPTLTAY